MSHSIKTSVSNDEMARLINTLKREYAYDLEKYAHSSLNRRINHILDIHNLNSINEVVKNLKEDDSYIHRFINELTVNVTELFRDTELWIRLYTLYKHFFRHKNQKIQCFHVGCSTGEETFSNVILLDKLKLLANCEITSGDINSKVLEKASMGIISKSNIDLYKHNYASVLNDEDFGQYFEEKEMILSFKKLENSECYFLLHDIVSDDLPNKYDVIFCRNLLIYFNSELQSLVLEKLYNNLKSGGLLILGAKESLIWYKKSYLFEVIDQKLKIFKKL